jgi:hypothetical protein
MSDYYDPNDPDTQDPIEGYCMRCRTSVEIEEPLPVWTRKGQAAVRGTCPLCGGVVFRMGKTALHDEKKRPSAIQIGDTHDKRTRAKLSRDTVYINYAGDDEEQAQQIGADLEKSGIPIWLHDGDSDATAWASGVHPALKECARMVLVLSAHTAQDARVQGAWEFFRTNRKPIVIAQIQPQDPPDNLRRSPRFNFESDYKTALRHMLNALSQ